VQVCGSNSFTVINKSHEQLGLTHQKINRKIEKCQPNH
jgi:hypothetical protein